MASTRRSHLSPTNSRSSSPRPTLRDARSVTWFFDQHPSRSRAPCCVAGRFIFSADIAAGELLDERQRSIHPTGTRAAPKHFNALMGATARTSIRRGTPTSWELVDVSNLKRRLDRAGRIQQTRQQRPSTTSARRLGRSVSDNDLSDNDSPGVGRTVGSVAHCAVLLQGTMDEDLQRHHSSNDTTAAITPTSSFRLESAQGTNLPARPHPLRARRQRRPRRGPAQPTRPSSPLQRHRLSSRRCGAVHRTSRERPTYR